MISVTPVRDTMVSPAIKASPRASHFSPPLPLLLDWGLVVFSFP